LTKYILSGLFFIGILFNLTAQKNHISWECNYNHFGINTGLPSSETYQVYQDRSGLLWILTDRGVVRYDGFQFHKYTVETGLCDNVNFRVVEDPNGGVWFIGFNGLLSVFKNGKMQAYKYNHKLEKAVPVGRNSVISLHINKDNSIIYCVFKKKMIAVSASGKIKDLSVRMNDNAYFFEFGNELLCLQKRNISKAPVFLIKNNQWIFSGKIHLAGTTRAKKHKGQYFLTTNYKLYILDSHGLTKEIHTPGDEVIGLDSDKDFLYIGLYKNGMKKYTFDKERKELVLVQHYLPNYSITSAYRDSNGTLWMTTLEKGLFAVYDEAFKQLALNGNKLNEEVRFISGNKHKIILNYYVGKWQQLYPPFLCKDVGKIVYKYNLLPVKDGFAFQRGIVNWSGWKDVDATYIANPVYTTNTSVIGMSRALYQIVEMKGSSYKTGYSVNDINRSELIGAYYWFYRFKNKKMFVLFDEGVFCFDLGNSKLKSNYRPVLRKRINELKYNEKWGLLAYSGLAGLYHINMENETYSGLAPHLNIGAQVSTIFFDEKNRLWVASEKGLFLLVKKDGKVVIDFFLNRNSLSSGEIMHMYAYNDVLYLATKFGVQKIAVSEVKEERKSFPLELFSVRAFASNKELPSDRIYPAKTDLIKISLFNKNLDRHVTYRYRFGKGETWLKSTKGDIVLNSPANGIYSLEVSYLDTFNNWSKPKVLSVFEVEKIIFLRWYFIFLYVFILLFLFYIGLKLSVQYVNKKNDMLNRMIELERMALAAQMNPHFIFNSLNSIHSFLLYDENENAEKYLLRFAKLIRQTLVNSRVNYITIAEEYETLKNYILLEHMRFKSEFVFRIECDFNQLPLYPCIPPMLIQPYVENAIIHGISKRKLGAELFIGFYKENDLLKIVIRDNGIGYKESIKNKRDTGHKSYGTKITEERLKSFQEKNNERFSVSMRVANEADTEFPGTEVVLIIPISTHLKNN
jgi:ligand-binding sensor domain-containing protein